MSVAARLKKQRRYETWLARIEIQREIEEVRGTRLLQAKGIGGERITRMGRIIPGEIERAYLLGDKRERRRIEEFHRPPVRVPKGEMPRTIPPEPEPWRGISDVRTLRLLESDLRLANASDLRGRKK